MMNKKDGTFLVQVRPSPEGIPDLAPQAVIQVAAKPDRLVDVDRWELLKLLLKLRRVISSKQSYGRKEVESLRALIDTLKYL
jgi:hypothetical protein